MNEKNDKKTLYFLQIVEVYSKGLKRQFYPEEYAEEQRLKKEQEEMENKK